MEATQHYSELLNCIYLIFTKIYQIPFELDIKVELVKKIYDQIVISMKRNILTSMQSSDYPLFCFYTKKLQTFSFQCVTIIRDIRTIEKKDFYNDDINEIYSIIFGNIRCCHSLFLIDVGEDLELAKEFNKECESLMKNMNQILEMFISNTKSIGAIKLFTKIYILYLYRTEVMPSHDINVLFQKTLETFWNEYMKAMKTNGFHEECIKAMVTIDQHIKEEENIKRNTRFNQGRTEKNIEALLGKNNRLNEIKEENTRFNEKIEENKK